MTSALIGHTGFVGGNLARQMRFDECYNSKNIEDIRGREFDLIVCAGAPGAKWYANEHPDHDSAALSRLLSALRAARVEVLILISTIDAIDASDSYGRRRALLESVLRELVAFNRVVIVRLPAIFGQALRKNALYDLMTSQRLDEIAPNATYQWYPLRRLSADLTRILAGDESTINITSEAISMEDVRARFFPRLRIGPARDGAPHYAIEGHPAYSLSRTEVFDEMGAFLAGYA